jgi:hypothetical protein
MQLIMGLLIPTVGFSPILARKNGIVLEKFFLLLVLEFELRTSH